MIAPRMASWGVLIHRRIGRVRAATTTISPMPITQAMVKAAAATEDNED